MENEKCLVVIEVSQKQKYIFCSNRLKENIGASIVIAKMTEEVPKEALKQYVKESKYDLGEVSQLCKEDIDQYIKKILISNGGGKSIYCFEKEEEADSFIKITSLYILKNYFGIEVFFAKHIYDMSTLNQMDAIEKLYANLREEKSRRRPSFRLYGLGLNEKCPSTALPIHLPEKDKDMPKKIKKVAEKYKQMIAEELLRKDSTHKIDTYGKDGFNLEVYTKLAAAENQDSYFEKEYLSEEDRIKYRFPHDMEELGGTKNEKNMIAIIALDGNGMGKRIESIQEELKKNHKEQEYLLALKQFSEYIKTVYTKAISGVVKMTCDKWEELNKKLSLTKEKKTGKKNIPIRPLIAAGDDICLITDARIGLSVAVCLLKKINEISKDRLKEKRDFFDTAWFQKVVSDEGLFASGGVVFCKQKYPFSRAYDLAESLCKNAKKKLKEEAGLEDASMIDFHVAMGEIDPSIEKERSRRSLQNGTKVVKPYVLGHNEYAFTFDNFEKVMDKLNGVKNGSEGKDNSNESVVREEKAGMGKIKELAYYIRQGNDVARSFINQSSRMKDRINFSGIFENKRDYTIFLDAIEILSLYEKIEEEKMGE